MPAEEEGELFFSSLLLEFDSVLPPDNKKVTKRLQIFSRQAPMMDAMISCCVDCINIQEEELRKLRLQQGNKEWVWHWGSWNMIFMLVGIYTFNCEVHFPNTYPLYFWVFITIIFIAYNIYIYIYIFKTKLLISLECQYNELQFGIGISSIQVSKRKLHIFTVLYVYNKTCRQQDIHLGLTAFSRMKGFRVFSNKCGVCPAFQ